MLKNDLVSNADWSVEEYPALLGLKQEVSDNDWEVAKLLRDFNDVSSSMCMDKDLVERMLAFHSNQAKIQLADAKNLIQVTRQQFRQFASRQLPFQVLKDLRVAS